MQKGVFSLLCRLLFRRVSSKRRGFQLIKAAFYPFTCSLLKTKQIYGRRAVKCRWKSTRWRFCDVHNLTNCSGTERSTRLCLCIYRSFSVLHGSHIILVLCPQTSRAESDRKKCIYMFDLRHISLCAGFYILRHSERQTDHGP